MNKVRLALTTLIVGLLCFGGAAQAASDKAAAQRGAQWLLKGSAARDGFGADALVALRASGKLSRAEAAERATALRAGAADYTRTAGATGKVILGLVASRSGNPRCANGIDLYRRLVRFRANGRHGRTAWDQSLAMLAMRSLGKKPPRLTIRFLLAARGTGGWNFTLRRSGRDDVTHTALVILALRAAGVSSSGHGLRAGVAWLRSQRTAAGGFAHERRDRNEANATALAVEALRATGHRDGRGIKALRSLQRADGAFQFTATDAGSRGLATVDAVVALSGNAPAVTKRAKFPSPCV